MAESTLVQLNFETKSYSVYSIIFMYLLCYSLAAFWYQVLLSPISSCIPFRLWFYLLYVATSLFYIESVCLHEITFTKSAMKISQNYFMLGLQIRPHNYLYDEY